MADPFANMASGKDSPADDWASLSLNADIATTPRALDCLTSGNVDIVSANGNTVTVALTAGSPYPCRPVRLESPSTGSAASGIIGLW